MLFRSKENKCYDVDGQEIWHSRSVAVVGMVIMIHSDEFYVLLGKRGEALPNEVGKWCMPCGFLDWDETCEDAVIREIWEETGLNIVDAMNKYNVHTNNMHYPWRINSTPDNPAQTVSLHYAIVMSTSPNIQHDNESFPEVTFENNTEPKEVDEVKWVNIKDLREYEMAFGHDSVINIYVNNLR